MKLWHTFNAAESQNGIFWSSFLFKMIFWNGFLLILFQNNHFRVTKTCDECFTFLKWIKWLFFSENSTDICFPGHRAVLDSFTFWLNGLRCKFCWNLATLCTSFSTQRFLNNYILGKLPFPSTDWMFINVN